MASDVVICNLALSHLGDSATVTSIDPPEGSVQAGHCAQFFSTARDTLLEMHTWGFATRRVALAALPSKWPEWDYCYAQPADALNLLEILPPDALDDFNATPGKYTPQVYCAETLANGTQVILTDQPSAVLKYTGIVEDPNQFSALFTLALSWHLAGMLAGPVLKGDVAITVGEKCAAKVEYYLGKAMESDANQRRIRPTQNVSWITGR
jgi:hypothetical protein